MSEVTSSPHVEAEPPAAGPLWEPGDRFRLGFNFAGVALGVVFAWQSALLGLGDPERPGSGLFPLIAGVVLVVFLLIDALRLFVRRRTWTPGTLHLSREAMVVLVAIALYLATVGVLGHALTASAIAVLLLTSLGSRPLFPSVMISLGIGFGSEVLFSALLGLGLPSGLLGIGWSAWM